MSEYKADEFMAELRSLHEQSIERGIYKDPEQKDSQNLSKNKNKILFDVDEFMQNADDIEWQNCCRFTNEEMNKITQLIEHNLPQHRGPKKQCSVKTILFIGLVYYSSNQQLHWIAKHTKLKVTTIMSYIETVRDEYFPILYNAEIGSGGIIPHKQNFINFPDAVGALDTTIIKHYRPSDDHDEKLTYSPKHHLAGLKIQALVNPDGLAIHIYIEPNGAKHDKLIAEESDLSDILNIKKGQQTIYSSFLCDKGYIGLEKTKLKGAIIMQKDGDPQQNQFIAQDRIIVERYFGRLKTTWRILDWGFRGDIKHLINVVKGLCALTNRLIKKSPLSTNDELKKRTQDETSNEIGPRKDIVVTMSPNQSTSTSTPSGQSTSTSTPSHQSTSCQSTSTSTPSGKSTSRQSTSRQSASTSTPSGQSTSTPTGQSTSTPSLSHQSTSTPSHQSTSPVLENIIKEARYVRNLKTIKKPINTKYNGVILPGISNQGYTCHLNVLIQLLYSINEIRLELQIFNKDDDPQPATALNDIFNEMDVIRMKQLKQTINTKQLTNALNNDKYWLKSQNFCESFEKMVDLLRLNIISKGGIDIYNLFGIKTVNREKYWITINSPHQDFTELLKLHLEKNDLYILPKILIVYVNANKTRKVPIPNTIDLSAISVNGNQKFKVSFIIAYRNSHYIIFKNFNGKWVKINDTSVSLSNEKEVSMLSGIDNNWYVDTLVLTEINYQIIGSEVL